VRISTKAIQQAAPWSSSQYSRRSKTVWTTRKIYNIHVH